MPEEYTPAHVKVIQLLKDDPVNHLPTILKLYVSPNMPMTVPNDDIIKLVCALQKARDNVVRHIASEVDMATVGLLAQHRVAEE